MLKGMKHSVICSGCREKLKQFDNLEDALKIEENNELSECCNSTFKYIGLQPYHEPVIKQPVDLDEDDNDDFIYDENIQIKENIDINDLIVPGTRGVTNAQMIPAIKKILKSNNIKNKLSLLKSEYNDVFKSSFKYLTKKQKEIIKNLFGEIETI